MTQLDTIVFDLGGVLIDWNPKYVFNQLFDNQIEMDYFFENICTSEWNIQQDAGRPLQEATDSLIEKHPHYESYIRAYYGRWQEMLGGPIQETVEILRHLINSKTHRILALTNWSNETFPVALGLYDFLHWFEGTVVSGDEKLIKPDPKIYQVLFDRYGVEPSKAVFIDDSLKNVKGANVVGMHGIHFQSSAQLKADLINKYGVPF
ncbi:MAG: HAD family phosphatase [Bacteroidetes bacterium]|jgi:2-haloacid dehalogenase|nr:HAD family phosphatase [Bacteroidota bacterium]MDF1864509.1 HAD family phosphatase [Saprospiraceae bacterium]